MSNASWRLMCCLSGEPFGRTRFRHTGCPARTFVRGIGRPGGWATGSANPQRVPSRFPENPISLSQHVTCRYPVVHPANPRQLETVSEMRGPSSKSGPSPRYVGLHGDLAASTSDGVTFQFGNAACRGSVTRTVFPACSVSRSRRPLAGGN